MNVASLLLGVTGLGFAAQLMGDIARPLGLFLALGFLGVAWLSGPAEGARRFRVSLLVAGLAVVAGALVLLAVSSQGKADRMLALGVLLAGADLLFRAFGRGRGDTPPLVATFFLAALLFLVLEYSPQAWIYWQKASLAASEFAGWLVGRPLQLSAAYSGFNILAVFIVCLLLVFLFTRKRSARRLLCALVYLAAVWFAYLMLMTLAPSYEEAAHSSELAAQFGKPAAEFLLPLFSRHVPWNLPLVLFLFELPAIWIVADRTKARRTAWLPEGRRGLLLAAALCLGLLLSAGVLVVRRPERPVRASRIVLYEKGRISWTSPDFRTFGEYAGGVMGRLPGFLRQLGFEVELGERLDEATLSGAGIAVVFNPDEKISDEEHAALWDFVRRGGSLLVIGEHTQLSEAGEDLFNHLLGPSDIRVNFDSATWHIGGWLHGYGFMADPLYYRVRDHLNQPGIGIGASLAVEAPAEPLLIGVHGYSDRGAAEREGSRELMGDSRYLPGERLGEVVLVAQQRFGAGRVVVVGDTTGFFNLLMVGSHEALSRLFGKLASPPLHRHHRLRLLGALVLLLTSCVIFARPGGRVLLPLLVLGLVAATALHVTRAFEAAAIDITPTGRIAYVDSSHGNRFSRESWRDNGLAGLYLNLMRNDVQPLRMDTFSPERLAGARMLFVISPSRRYTEREADEVEAFIRRGGYVVVCAGADSDRAVDPILARFGLRVRNVPLGPFSVPFPSTSGKVRFHVGYAVEDRAGDASGVLAWYDQPGTTAVMIERRPAAGEALQRGGLLLIGDGKFLLCKNLEPMKEPPIMENVEFLRWLVGHIDGADETERKP